MQGLLCEFFLFDCGYKYWFIFLNILVDNFVCFLDLLFMVLFDYDCVFCMLGIGVIVQDMIDFFVRVGGEDKFKYIMEKDDEDMKKIFYLWFGMYDNLRVLKFGFKKDDIFDDIVCQYKVILEVFI